MFNKQGNQVFGRLNFEKGIFPDPEDYSHEAWEDRVILFCSLEQEVKIRLLRTAVELFRYAEPGKPEPIAREREIGFPISELFALAANSVI
jgi:hypothetical protein